jgi:LPS O-antigen subunit length determinant protein (WzzB/FepE family)
MLKPVLFPSEKTAPNRSLIGVVWLFLGVVASIGFVLAKEPVTSIVQKIVNKED